MEVGIALKAEEAEFIAEDGGRLFRVDLEVENGVNQRWNGTKGRQNARIGVETAA